MGIEYYLIDVKKKTFYDLGKGGWYVLNLEYIPDVELLAIEIKQNIFRYYENDKEFEQYIDQRVVPDIVRYFGNSDIANLRIVSDCCDDLTVMRAKQYIGVGSRYDELGSEGHKRSMNFLNRHLNEQHKYLYEKLSKKDFDEDIWEKY